jgi:hypothetical protein
MRLQEILVLLNYASSVCNRLSLRSSSAPEEEPFVLLCIPQVSALVKANLRVTLLSKSIALLPTTLNGPQLIAGRNV